MFAPVLILIFLLFLSFPETISSGAAYGLASWSKEVFPLLFPYMVLTGIIAKSSAAAPIASFCHPFLGKLFCLSPMGSYCLLCGALCGYPLGAMLAASLYDAGEISQKEYPYLLSLCSLPGPSFLLGFLFHQCGYRQLLPPFFGMLLFYGAIFLVSVLSRKYYHITGAYPSHTEARETTLPFPLAVSEGLGEAMASQLKVCSCIVFFSGLSFLINHLISLSGLPIPQILPLILTGITEMTLGIKRLSEYALTPLTFGLSAFFLGFGGISIAAQVYSVTRTKKTRQPFGGYLVWKLLFGLILSLLFFGSALLYRHLDV